MFTPRFDGQFFPHDPLALIDFSPPKPTLFGFTKLEGLGELFSFLCHFAFFTINGLPVSGFTFGQNTTLSLQALPLSASNNYTLADLQLYIQNEVVPARLFNGNTERAAQAADAIFQFYSNPNVSDANAAVKNNTHLFAIYQYITVCFFYFILFILFV